MRNFRLLLLASLLAPTILWGQSIKDIRYVDASQLTLVGKALPTPHLYHRIDTVAFKGFSKSENQQARCSAGLAVVFRTNSPQIDLLPSYKWEYRKDNVTGIAAAGFDLYIRQNNEWIYANSLAPAKRNEAFTLMYGMEPKEKECLVKASLT